ncbi:hypothetical protein L596_024029 [Steinernema carpocapsae]|uniref:Uncharacterized protein n=1 Tax=Steinernema carpocapsae TaxID=34508 RepID=A0A4V6XVV0_STECR|nr:hypothetical protein L596_024029 [Steinernema carpocapsae]
MQRSIGLQLQFNCQVVFKAHQPYRFLLFTSRNKVPRSSSAFETVRRRFGPRFGGTKNGEAESSQRKRSLEYDPFCTKRPCIVLPNIPRKWKFSFADKFDGAFEEIQENLENGTLADLEEFEKRNPSKCKRKNSGFLIEKKN